MKAVRAISNKASELDLVLPSSFSASLLECEENGLRAFVAVFALCRHDAQIYLRSNRGVSIIAEVDRS